ncbi:MAG: SDR family oxidoreductase [Candidatus Dactylopiibacterium sp.]|nr:SDR family oxidoreductase [Candidatus Dactylopiibacterium sp.]
MPASDPSVLSGTALVTGASSGIGEVYAGRLAARGHKLVLVARDEARLNVLAARLRSLHGVAVDLLPADLTLPDALARVETRLAEDASIGVLVNNAGATVAGRFVEADIGRVEQMLRLNVIAPTRLAAAAARGFVARGGGTLINIASVTALMPEDFSGTYAGSKAYLLALSQSLDAELADAGVRVQVVLPGVTRTAIWDAATLEHLPPAMIMEVGDMVDAALAGLEQGEVVTIPSLPDSADWQALQTLRRALAPQLSRDRPATRYRLS